MKTHAFGDALLATPAVSALTAAGGSWTALAGPASVEVWRRQKGIARVICAPFPPEGAGGMIRLMAWTAAGRHLFEGVEHSVVFHASPSVRRWIRFLTHCGMSSGGSVPLGRWEDARGFDTGALASDSYARIAGVPSGDPRPLFEVSPDEARRAAELIGGGRWLAIAPGGGRNPRDVATVKQWPADRFAGIARRASSGGWRILVVGGRGDEVAAALTALAVPEGSLNMAGKAGWGLTAALLARCGAFLGVDSGAAHLATAVGTDAVVLFGPTDPDALYAPGLVKVVRTTSPCAPCYANEVFPGCRTGGSSCMLNIQTDEAWESLEQVLNAHTGA